MAPAQIFSVVSTMAALQWMLLIIFPKWRVTQWLINYPIVPILLSGIYCVYITGFFSIQGGGFNSIQEVRRLFANDGVLLAGWVHYLAFDLLIGFSIIKSAQAKAISHWLVIPCLILTFMFGPCGFLLYQVVQKNKKINMKTLFTHIRAISPALYYCGLAHLALFVLMIIIAQFDHRQLMGINLWTKPIKFAISIAIYCLTWPLLLQYLPFEQLKKRFANFTVFAMVFEMLAIASQAARGQLSHYNTSGVYNALLFSAMGIIIVSQTLFALYIGVRFFKVSAIKITPALLWAIRLGILMAGFFALEGGIMASRLSHTVGAADGGPGLPLFNWSRIAGDLRIAHFMGLHALQIVPLFVVLTNVKSARPVIVFAFAYFVIVSMLFINAMLGRPLF